MNYTGLLTKSEAMKAVECGYDRNFLVVDSAGFMEMISWIDLKFFEEEEYGFAVPPGHFLPMTCAPLDEREVLLIMEILGERLAMQARWPIILRAGG